MVTKLLRPLTVAEALSSLAEDPSALPLAGGTYLLTNEFRTREQRLVSVSGILPKSVEAGGEFLELGAGLTFQDLVDSAGIPGILHEAARSMSSRNIRNRATLGGNLGADKSCASLVPALLVLGAELEMADASRSYRVDAAEWLGRADITKRELILRVIIHNRPGRVAAFRRYARTASDISLLTAAVSYRLADGAIREPRIAMGGLGPHARRFAEIEALIEGKKPEDRDEIENAVAPLLAPVADIRGSAEFKRLRAATLLAEAIVAADGTSGAGTGREARP